LLSTKFLLKDEGNKENFLGIKIDHDLAANGTVMMTMTQPGLINQILENVGLVGNKVMQKKMPACKALHATPMLLLLMQRGIIPQSLES
jgi:hypothetical protein